MKPVTVDARAIPWLLLSAASTVHGKGGDLLGDTTFIQRTKTRGGLAPAAADCNAATVGARAEVPYTADYNFWERVRPRRRPRRAGRGDRPASRIRHDAGTAALLPLGHGDRGTDTTQIRAESFPDLGDEVMYPRMSAAKIERLAEMGTRRSFAAGETLYEQGQRDAPFLVIESGRVHVLDRKPGKDVWVAEADAGTFLGDIATFTGEPAIAECVADEPTDVIAFDRPALRAMLASWPEMAEMMLRAMMARREWHERNGHGVLRLIAPRGSRRAFEVRDLLERNLIPVRWYDVDTDDGQRGDARLAADPARGDAGPRAQHRRAAQPVGRPGRARARACARTSTASGSTSSCSAAAPPGWRRRSTAAPRGCARS